MAVPRTLVGLASVAMLIQLSMAASYTVGGTNGWDTSTDLQTWVASKKITVGDSLTFQYTPNHNVLEVSKGDYDSCQTSSPIKTYSDGNTVITLASPGKKYFICGTTGHCIQGMKIEVDILATAPSSPPSASPAKSPSSPPSASPAKSPSTSPSASPAPKTSPSPANSPELAPASPSPSSSDVPSIESPGTSPSPNSLSPTPPSSANRASFQTSLKFGFGLVLTVLLAM